MSIDGHVFIASASANQKIAKRLARDLLSSGIRIWSPYISQKPGQKDTERARFAAMHEAVAVLLIATPASHNSDDLRDDLAIADMVGVQVFPVWAEGSQWEKCLPADHTYQQYIDLRDENYLRGLWQITHLLEGHDIEMEGEDPPPTHSDALTEPRNPYKALRAFQEKDQGDFFGRGNLIQTLLATIDKRTETPRFLSVIGASGSGKTSLITAGLIPALKAGALPLSKHWVYPGSMTPGKDPIEATARILEPLLPELTQNEILRELNNPTRRGLLVLAQQIVSGRKQRMILVIDQFEDLFIHTDSENERQHFIDLLTNAAEEPDGQLIILAILRAEFYDRPLQYARLGQLFNEASIDMLPMRLADLHAAIQYPANLPDVRISFEPEVIEALVLAAREYPGQLPLLQFVLSQLVLHQDERTITMSAYRAIGNLRDSFESHAERVFQNFPTDEHRKTAQFLLMTMVHIGKTEQETTLQSMDLRSLEFHEEAQMQVAREVLDALNAAQIVHISETIVEISHEIVLRAWKRLAGWIYTARDDLRLGQIIAQDTLQWEQAGQSEELLYRGIQLAEAESWAERQNPDIHIAVFLVASRSKEDSESGLEYAGKSDRDSGQKQELSKEMRSLIGALFFITIVVLSIVIYVQNQITQRAQDSADMQSTRAANAMETSQAAISINATQVIIFETAQAEMILESNNFATQQTLANEAIQRSEEQVAIAETAQAEANRQRDLAATYQAVAEHETSANMTQVVLADEAMTAAADQRSIAETQQAIANASVDDQATQIVIAATAGAEAVSQRMAVATQVAIAETAQGETQSLRDQAATQAAIAETAQADANQQRQFAATEIVRAETAQAETRNLRDQAATQAAIAGTAQVDADQQRGVAATEIMRVETAQAEIQNLRDQATAQASSANQPAEVIQTVVIEVTQSLVIAQEAQQTAQAAEELIATQQAQINHLVETQKTLEAHASENALASTAQPNIPEPELPVTDLPGAIDALLDDPNGDHQLAALLGIRFALQEDNPHMGDFLQQILNSLISEGQVSTGLFSAQHPGGVTSLATSEDGQSVLSGGFDGTIRVWDGSSGEIRLIVEGHLGEVSDVAVAFDDQYGISAGQDGTVRFWELASGEPMWVLQAHKAGITSIAISADGQYVLTGSHDNTARLWDIASGEEINTFQGHQASVTAVAISMDNSKIITASRDNTIIVWDREGGEILMHLEGHQGDISSLAISPDQQMIASGSWDGSVRVWDLQTGAEVHTLSAHTDIVSSVAFSPDSNTLASGSWDGSVRLWDLQTGTQEPVSTSDIPVSDVLYRADTSHLIVGYWDGSIREQVIGSNNLIETICGLLDRDLSAMERTVYGIEDTDPTCP